MQSSGRFLFCSLWLLLLLSGCAINKKPNQSERNISPIQSDPLKTLIAVELLQTDVDHLVSLVKKIHPEPYSLISEQQFQVEAQLIKQSIKYPLSRGEFYLRIAPLMTKIGDIHSSVKLPKFSENSQNKLFPLAVLYEKNALYVAADLSNIPKVPVGAIIKSINGAPIEFVLQVMKRLIVNETESGHRRRIQVNFPWLLTVMGYGAAEYQVSYWWKSNTENILIEGLPVNSKKENRVKKNTKATKMPSFYGVSQPTDQTALLWFNDFNENPRVFKSFLKKQFKHFEKQNTQNLIIDLRYNDGGLSQNIKSLLSYLSKEPIYWAESGEIKTSKALKKLHREKTKQRRKDKYQWGLQWLPLEWTDYSQFKISLNDVDEHLLIEFEKVTVSDVAKPANIIVLTNGFCFSACSSLVATINDHKMAQTIGEAAGSFAQVQYVYPLTTPLFHSKLELLLPTMKLLLNKKHSIRNQHMKVENSLIKPTFSLQRDQEHIINRQDYIMNEAIKRLEGRVY